jgi:hypothetical protein
MLVDVSAGVIRCELTIDTTVAGTTTLNHGMDSFVINRYVFHFGSH